MKLSLALLTALVAPLLAGAVSVHHDRRVPSQSLNPHNVELHDPLAIAPQGDNLSNGERLRRGLTPKSPRHVHTPTRAQAARRAGASAVPHTGYIKVVNVEDNSERGFIRQNFNAFGEYGLTDNIENALPISFSVAPGDPSVFDIINHNPEQSSTYPFVGLTTGYASSTEDLDAESYDYAYLTGVQGGKNAASDNKPNSFTAATGFPKSSQSTIWRFDAGSSELSAHWVNADGSSILAELLYYGADDVVTATGSSVVFKETFGASGIYKIKLIYVGA